MRKKSAGHNIQDVEAFKEKLKSFELKATPQRIAVHEAMLVLVHATADMVAEHISAAGSTRISVASVYNILSGMADLGIYARRLSPGNKMWFDVNSFKHLHAFDDENGTFIDIIDDDLVKSLEDRLKKTRVKGYKIDRMDVQLICRPARRKTLKK